MATVVFLHAHPDDECMLTGGTIALLADAGHDVVLVTATGGELGEVPEGLLAPGETLKERRAKEVLASARVLGAEHVMLGYLDSGMAGTDGNAHPDAFCNADLEEAAARLADLLLGRGADVLVTYDEHGGYGHPDHVMVHKVGHRAAELAGTPSVFEASIDRDRVLAFMQEAMASGEAPEGVDGVPTPEELATFGLPAEAFTTRIDTSAHAAAKRASMACHETQVGDMGFFLSMPEARFAQAMTEEAYRCVRAPGPVPTDRLV